MNKKKLLELINEAEIYTYENNSGHFGNVGIFSRAGSEMLAWTAECQDFILKNFGNKSAPWELFKEFNRASLDGNDIDEFDRQKKHIISALKAAKRLISETKLSTKIEKDKTKVFIVHGHDDAVKINVARFIEKLNIEAIILHEKPSSGKTIIEKIEEYSDVGFGIVLYTPCDIGSKKGDEKNIKPRARQNVVFEHGFLIGKIGRNNVCALVKDETETPNDISGVVYISLNNDWKIDLAKELRNSGYEVDMNLVI